MMVVAGVLERVPVLVLVPVHVLLLVLVPVVQVVMGVSVRRSRIF